MRSGDYRYRQENGTHLQIKYATECTNGSSSLRLKTGSYVKYMLQDATSRKTVLYVLWVTRRKEKLIRE